MRLITVEDIPEIIGHLLVMREESPVFCEVDPDPEYTARHLTAMIQHRNFLGLIEPGRGFMFGSVSSTWYNPRVDAYDYLLYVSQSARNGILAVRLIKQFEQMAKSAGAAYMCVGISSGMNVERTTALYKKLGYEAFSSGLRKKL